MHDTGRGIRSGKSVWTGPRVLPRVVPSPLEMGPQFDHVMASMREGEASPTRGQIPAPNVSSVGTTVLR